MDGTNISQAKKTQRESWLCVGNQDRGKLLVKSFQQNICSVLEKILYTPCGCSNVLSLSSAPALLTQQVQTPQAPSSRRASLSNLCCLLLFQLSGSSRNSLLLSSADWDCAPGWLPGTSTASLSREESSGKQLFPGNPSLKDTCIFELHTSSCRQSLQGSNWNNQKVIPQLCVWLGARNTPAPCGSFASPEPSCSLTCSASSKGDLLALICSRQQMSWKQTYLFLDQFASFLGLP